MTTSSSYNWKLNRNEAILMAFQEINVYGTQDSSVGSNDLSFAIKKLNGMLKMWSLDGIKTTKRNRAYLFPALLQHEYSLGSVTSSDHCSDTYVSTTISSAEAAGQTVISLTSTTGMTAADNIGIELDSGTRQWTTIVSVDSSTQVTITAALTGAAAAANTVVTYTTKINRPLEILYGTTLDLKSTSKQEVSLAPMSHDEYYKMPVKNTVGRPNQFYYDNVLAGVAPYRSSLFVYPEPQTVSTIIAFEYIDAIQDMDTSTDDFNLPQEWLYVIVFNLACELAYSYGKFTELEKIQPKATAMYEALKDLSSDNTPMTFTVGRR
jgi:hypothetical protein